MPSRQDQLHSYQFMVQRVVAALVLRETDPAQSPFRRAAGSMLASLLVAAIALGVAVVYGVFVGADATDWRESNAVIIEKESGARYVYQNGKLHLVLNYASALLVIGNSEQRTILVSRKSLAGVTRGAPLGIPGAPDSLPPVGQLDDGAWTICSVGSQDAGTTSPRSVLLIGRDATGGRAMTNAGLLGQHPDGSLFLIWQNRRFLLRDPDFVLSALGWAGERPAQLAPALLNALAAGPDLGRITISERGGRSIEVPGARVGEVFVVTGQGGGSQYAVAQRDGLAVITQLQANLLLTEATNHQEKPTPMPQSRFAELPKARGLVPAGPVIPPATTPRLMSADGAICAQVSGDTGVKELRVGVAAPETTGVPPVASVAPRSNQVLVDHVMVLPGRGVLVEAVAAPGATGGAISIVTDLGRRHSIADSAVLGMLGYGGRRPLRLPASVVTMVPAGPTLDPAAARTPVGVA